MNVLRTGMGQANPWNQIWQLPWPPKLEDDGFPIDAIHADNDSTTIMKLKMVFKDLKKKDDQKSYNQRNYKMPD